MPSQHRRVELPLEERELLGSAEVCALLGIDRNTLTAFNREGVIPAPVDLPMRDFKWRRRELADWIDAGCPPRSSWEWHPGFVLELEQYIEILAGQIAKTTDQLARARLLLAEGERTIRVSRDR